jgi:hypothetical protein
MQDCVMRLSFGDIAIDLSERRVLSGQQEIRLTPGTRSVVIARRVAWSHDDRFIFAAVAEVDADIVSMSLTGAGSAGVR